MSITTTTTHDQDHERDYSGLLEGVRRSFGLCLESHRLFQTDADDLWEVYLVNLPPEDRQYHTCSACRRFIETYGGLVSIDALGYPFAAMWDVDLVPEYYRPAFSALTRHVERHRVRSVFLSKEPVWGTPVTGDWTHPAVEPPAGMIYRDKLLTAGQAMAASRENYRTVATALGEFKSSTLDQAIRLVQAEKLARSEKFIGPLQWLRDLQNRPKGRHGENVLWRAIATAPEGYCHPRASVVGSLLEDIAAGLSFEDVKRKFDAKMHPLQYQRPQAAPTAGNIKAAEAIVEKMGIVKALERRFARVDEVPCSWRPEIVAPPESSGVFGHLKPKSDRTPEALVLSPTTMTWEKFSRTILLYAKGLELHVPTAGRFVALTTAVDPDAPPILKWDRPSFRNPVAWFVYPNGSFARTWGLTAGSWIPVVGITSFPCEWGPTPMPFIAEGFILLLDGAVDSNPNAGNALFPECLNDGLHAVRATIEAYSRRAVLSGREPGAACGYDIRKAAADCHLRAFVNGAWDHYRIDRWD